MKEACTQNISIKSTPSTATKDSNQRTVELADVVVEVVPLEETWCKVAGVSDTSIIGGER